MIIDPPALLIADNCSIATIAAAGSVIDANDSQRLGSRAAIPTYNPRKCKMHFQKRFRWVFGCILTLGTGTKTCLVR